MYIILYKYTVNYIISFYIKLLVGFHMPRKGWVNISLPEEIVSRIDKAVGNSKYGFRSRADFVLEAVKNQLRELGYYP